MYKAQFMMKNWDDPDVQWNIALGNTDQMEAYAKEKLEFDKKLKELAQPERKQKPEP
jgi:hypothetical protein